MTNQKIAEILRNVAASYFINGENKFKIIAYNKAAETIQNSLVEARDLWKEGKLSAIPGVGKSIASYLDELFRTGKVKHFEKILQSMPQAMFPLLNVPGFGPKKAFKLVMILKLTNPETVIKDLFKAAKDHRIASIEGFGDRSQKDIMEALERFTRGRMKENRMPLLYADIQATAITTYLKHNKDTIEALPLGSLRRKVATIGDIDIAVSTNNPKSVIDWFLKYPKMEKTIEKGSSGASILLDNGIQVDLRIQYPGKFGAMLQYFTGSKRHNIHLREIALRHDLSLSEYGIKPLSQKQKKRLSTYTYDKKLKVYEIAKEENFYKVLGLPWIPPELREDSGEIDEALQNRLPLLVSLDDIKGDFHLHTNYDLKPSHDLGVSSLKNIMLTADKLGYEYIGISDHNPSFSNHNNRQIVHIMKRRSDYIEHIQSSTKSVRVKLFIMLEIDILPDGHLALPDEAFQYIDAAIVSIHSSFTMNKDKMTARILSGLSHPKVKILAHPTGRLLGKRDSYEVDWTKIFDFCKKNKKALEINAFPERLDLPDSLVHEAVHKGVILVVNTDSHECMQMPLMRYGVSVARRGWAKKSDILNSMPYNKVKHWMNNTSSM